MNGELIANSDNLVTWALRAADEAERRAKAFAFASLEGASVVLAVADGERAPWNCSRRARLVARIVESCFDIMCGAGGTRGCIVLVSFETEKILGVQLIEIHDRGAAWGSAGLWYFLRSRNHYASPII